MTNIPLLKVKYSYIKPTFPKFHKKQRNYSYLDADGVDLLESMIVLNPKKRISIADALKHKYFQMI